ncbi:MAG: PhnD/SsuA/transferrin family substrate-binding protein, partial [Gammaproteobacteria bacterium]|nr:PhnD/SsuA/transferrin family substrate-binding protein [Gammaproteobacteria bacterium]
FVLAEAEIGAVPLLAEVYRGSPWYTGRVFVRRDSGIETLADLRGRDIAFADPISESGYLFPLDLFVEAGLIPASNLFFMDSISPEEKKDLIERKHINESMIKNRLQNAKISQEERDMLESYI